MLDQLLLKCDFRQIAVITYRFEVFDVRGALKICPVFIKLFSTLLEAHEISGQHVGHNRLSDLEEHPYAMQLWAMFVWSLVEEDEETVGLRLEEHDQSRIRC